MYMACTTTDISTCPANPSTSGGVTTFYVAVKGGTQSVLGSGGSISISISGGKIVGCTVVSAGSGYSPYVQPVLSGGSFTLPAQLAVTSLDSNGTLKNCSVPYEGSGYSTTPTVSLGNGTGGSSYTCTTASGGGSGGSSSSCGIAVLPTPVIQAGLWGSEDDFDSGAWHAPKHIVCICGTARV